ncbi:hypothetical protein MY4824_003510 [Beauveria thailandica]
MPLHVKQRWNEFIDDDPLDHSFQRFEATTVIAALVPQCEGVVLELGPGMGNENRVLRQGDYTYRRRREQPAFCARDRSAGEPTCWSAMVSGRQRGHGAALGAGRKDLC